MMYLVMALGVVAMISGASFATWNVTSSFYRSREARVIAEGIAVEAQRRADIATQMIALERKQAEVREVEVVKWKTVKKEVERVVASDPVYVRLECRVTDDGVRVYNAAAAGLQLAAVDGKDAVVPKQPAVAEGGGAAGRPPVDSGSGRRAIPRLPTGS